MHDNRALARSWTRAPHHVDTTSPRDTRCDVCAGFCSQHKHGSEVRDQSLWGLLTVSYEASRSTSAGPRCLKLELTSAPPSSFPWCQTAWLRGIRTLSSAQLLSCENDEWYVIASSCELCRAFNASHNMFELDNMHLGSPGCFWCGIECLWNSCVAGGSGCFFWCISMCNLWYLCTWSSCRTVINPWVIFLRSVSFSFSV